MTDNGWSTEIAIPFKSISFDPESETWGVNFGRWIMRKQEFDLWSSNQRLWWAGDSGEMTGIRDIQQGLGSRRRAIYQPDSTFRLRRGQRRPHDRAVIGRVLQNCAIPKRNSDYQY
jgi:hypothetical protein